MGKRNKANFLLVGVYTASSSSGSHSVSDAELDRKSFTGYNNTPSQDVCQESHNTYIQYMTGRLPSC